MVTSAGSGHVGQAWFARITRTSPPSGPSTFPPASTVSVETCSQQRLSVRVAAAATARADRCCTHIAREGDLGLRLGEEVEHLEGAHRRLGHAPQVDHACPQRYRWHLEKNATQMLAISWRLTKAAVERCVATGDPSFLEHVASGNNRRLLGPNRFQG